MFWAWSGKAYYTKKIWRALWLLGVSALISSLALSASGDEIKPERLRALRAAGEIVPLEQVLSDYRQQQPHGRILEIELEQEKPGLLVYEVYAVDTKGIVTEFQYDARTGQLLKQEVEGREQRKQRKKKND